MPLVPVPAAAASEESPTRETPARTGEKASPASSGNAVVADKAPSSPPAPAPAAGAIAEKQLPLAVVPQLAGKNAEIADLQAQVAKPMTKAQVEKPMTKATRVTMSTEAAGVPVCPDKYWVTVDTKKKKKETILVVEVTKSKADSTTGLHSVFSFSFWNPRNPMRETLVISLEGYEVPLQILF